QGKARRQATRLHRHCETCYSRHCRAPIEISVSCLPINCRNHCGAAFHMCKEDEHMLLCPNEKVPCLNACNGCPFTMCRSKLAQHLEVCPASVMCCSMEWNRWPIEDVQSSFNINILKETKDGFPLDLSMALTDQKKICARLKMNSFFPELMEEPEEEDAEDDHFSRETEFNGDHMYGSIEENTATSPNTFVDTTVDVETQKLVDKKRYNLYEKMFSMEKGGCKEASNTLLDGRKQVDKKISTKQHMANKTTAPSEDDVKKTYSTDTTKTGFAPWQDGVLERLGQEVNPREFNMYIVHHGRMLIAFGQMDACTPREKDFVYGDLEPIPVQTLRSFKVPTSYRERFIRKNPSARVQTEHKLVDTSDLGGSREEIDNMDETYATLLCASEFEIRGHKISEKVATDGLYVDIATQTYNFRSAPFKYNTTLADITEDRDLKLYVQTTMESVTGRHNKSSSAFNLLCGHSFRRDEFFSHFKNVHLDIQSGLEGWFEQRCPLSYLGCTYVKKRFQPFQQKASVAYRDSIFVLKPETYDSSSQLPISQASNASALSSLPYEILCHIASFLDSYSLSQMALVSHLFREVCATHLQQRGMLCLKWRRKKYSHGGVWEFSNLFSKVDKWCFGDFPSMAEHLKHCPFYKREIRVQPVALTNMHACSPREKGGL
uniref:F-box protein 40, tandem duplicate 2 n=1 Tax=Denticeps clupeoides TaxID=299321 RepID=A0AAY4BM55_9TELE